MKLDVVSKTGNSVATVDGLLSQIERAATHYDMLDLEYTASGGQIQTAYGQAVKRLRHAQQAASHKSLPDASVEGRVTSALKRLAQAFSVLTDVGKKTEYDQFMLGRSAPVTDPTSLVSEMVKGLTLHPEAANAEEDNRRRSRRINLSITAQVVGYDRKAGRWEETAETVNVSRTGISVRLNRQVRHGLVVMLTLPLPVNLRNYGLTELNYAIYAIVRRVQPAKGGGRFIGLEFVGEHPPAAYASKPWTLFRTKNWQGMNRRRHPRRDCNDIITLEYFDQAYQLAHTEIVRAENISEQGMRVVARTAPAEVELLRFCYSNQGSEHYALVSNRYVGEDGFERLCLKLVDNTDVAEQMRAHEQQRLEEAMNAQQGVPLEMPVPALAVIPDPRPQPLAFVPPLETAQPATCTKKILVADDDLSLRRVLGKILKSAGYDVILVEDGLAAVETAREEKPDLVITDALMPRLHGFLACKEIKQIKPTPKVIMLTAVYTKCSYRVEATQRYGADELLTKPFVVADLLACIEKHLAADPASLSL